MIRPPDDRSRSSPGEPQLLRPISAPGLALTLLMLCSAWSAPVAAELRLLQAPSSAPPHLQPILGHHLEPTGHPLPEEVFPLQLVFYGEPPEGLTKEEIKEAIKGAARAWNQVPCSWARLKWAGFRDERDDKLKLCQLYPQRGSECADDANCPGACVESPWGRVCDIQLGAVGDYCGFELQHCPDYCHLSEPALGIGYCSTACADDEACPESFRCERPENFTTSVCIFAPSPELLGAGCATSATSRGPLFWLVIALAALAVFLAQRRSS